MFPLFRCSLLRSHCIFLTALHEKTESHIFSQLTKTTFQSPNANKATFIILRHPVTILVTAFTKTDKFDYGSPHSQTTDLFRKNKRISEQRVICRELFSFSTSPMCLHLLQSLGLQACTHKVEEAKREQLPNKERGVHSRDRRAL